MHYYKLLISYDGTGYTGWQAQKELPSIAHTIVKTFSTIFAHTATIRGASRTDAGVHARGQVAMIRTELAITPEKLKMALNNRLPGSIVIREASITDEACDIFANIDHKVYHYNVFTDRPSPFACRYGWYVDYPLNFDTLRQVLQLFVGTHDFSSFCSSEDTRENKVRTIYSIDLERDEFLNSYRIVIKGNAFLRHMIRRIVGASIEIAGRKDVSIDKVRKALEETKSVTTLLNAPACGLTLDTIVYKPLKEEVHE